MSFAALFLLPKPAAKKEGNESRPAGQTAPSPCEEECSVKRYYYKKEKVLLCARALFGQKEDYREDNYRKYQGMEVVVHPDGRFSVWGNLGEEDADLLRDTKPDHANVLPQAMALADDVTNE